MKFFLLLLSLTLIHSPQAELPDPFEEACGKHLDPKETATSKEWHQHLAKKIAQSPVGTALRVEYEDQSNPKEIAVYRHIYGELVKADANHVELQINKKTHSLKYTTTQLKQAHIYEDKTQMLHEAEDFDQMFSTHNMLLPKLQALKDGTPIRFSMIHLSGYPGDPASPLPSTYYGHFRYLIVNGFRYAPLDGGPDHVSFGGKCLYFAALRARTYINSLTIYPSTKALKAAEKTDKAR